MGTILESDFTLETLANMFEIKNIASKIIEVAPAVPALDLKRDAYIEINFNN